MNDASEVMWAAAFADADSERQERAMTAAKVGLAELWSLFAAAQDAIDLDNRIALMGARIERLAQAVASEYAIDPEDLADDVIASIKSDYVKMQVARKTADENPFAKKDGDADDSGGSTCSVCGDPIERDPEGEENRTWHHTNGEKHDHEASPKGGDKESRRRRAFKVREMEGRSYEATCSNPDCESNGVSFVRDDLFADDDDEATCPDCGTPLVWGKKESRRIAALSRNCTNGNHSDCKASGNTSCTCSCHKTSPSRDYSGACADGDHDDCKMTPGTGEDECACPHHKQSMRRVTEFDLIAAVEGFWNSGSDDLVAALRPVAKVTSAPSVTKGWKLVWQPKAIVTHNASLSGVDVMKATHFDLYRKAENKQPARVGPGPTGDADRCPTCWGKGWVEMEGMERAPTCPDCKGTGIKKGSAYRLVVGKMGETVAYDITPGMVKVKAAPKRAGREADSGLILEQIGRGELMNVGARDFVSLPDGIQFTIGMGRNIAKVIITLDWNDTYTLVIGHGTIGKGKGWVEDYRMDGLYNDMLGSVLRSAWNDVVAKTGIKQASMRPPWEWGKTAGPHDIIREREMADDPLSVGETVEGLGTVREVHDHTYVFDKDGWTNVVQRPFVNEWMESTPHHKRLLEELGIPTQIGDVSIAGRRAMRPFEKHADVPSAAIEWDSGWGPLSSGRGFSRSIQTDMYLYSGYILNTSFYADEEGDTEPGWEWSIERNKGGMSSPIDTGVVPTVEEAREKWDVAFAAITGLPIQGTLALAKRAYNEFGGPIYVRGDEWGISYQSPIHGSDDRQWTLSVYKMTDEPNQWGGVGGVLHHPEYDGLKFPSQEAAEQFALEHGLVHEFIRRKDSMRKGAPFADYKDFADCVAKNGDKSDPEAYCGKIKHEVEGRRTAFNLAGEPTSDDEEQRQSWTMEDAAAAGKADAEAGRPAFEGVVAWPGTYMDAYLEAGGDWSRKGRCGRTTKETFDMEARPDKEFYCPSCDARMQGKMSRRRMRPFVREAGAYEDGKAAYEANLPRVVPTELIVQTPGQMPGEGDMTAAKDWYRGYADAASEAAQRVLDQPDDAMFEGSRRTALDQASWQADFDKFSEAIASAGGVIDLGDGTQGIDQTKVDPEIVRLYGDLLSIGYANGFLASKQAGPKKPYGTCPKCGSGRFNRQAGYCAQCGYKKKAAWDWDLNPEGDEDTSVVECPECGTAWPQNLDECPGCGISRIDLNRLTREESRKLNLIWTKVGVGEADMRMARRPDVEALIGDLRWQPYRRGMDVPQRAGEVIAAAVRQLRLPRVTALGIDGSFSSRPYVYGIEANYRDGPVRIYVGDHGDKIVPLAAERDPNNPSLIANPDDPQILDPNQDPNQNPDGGGEAQQPMGPSQPQTPAAAPKPPQPPEPPRTPVTSRPRGAPPRSGAPMS